MLTENGVPVPIGGPFMPNLEAKLRLAPPSVDRDGLRRWEEQLCGHVRHAGETGLLCGPAPPDHADAVRIYADWLDEQGWPEFAAAVRVSLTLEKDSFYLSAWLYAHERGQRFLDAITGGK